MQARFIALLLLFLSPLYLLAAIEPFSGRIEGTQITTTGGPHLTVTDAQYNTMSSNPTTWPASFTNQTVTNRVRLGINPNVLQTNALSGNVTLQIKSWTWSGSAFVSNTVTQALSVNYSMTPTDVIDETATYAFTGAHKIEITVIGIDAAVDVNDVYVQAEIEVERYYAFNGIAPTSPSVAVSGQYVNFTWAAVTGAELYELEWVHVNDYTAADSTTTIASSDLKYNFYRNSTRVILRTNSYKVPKLFDRGYLLFRVRAVGLTGTGFAVRKEGNWTVAESGVVSSLSATTNYVYISNWADRNMNWSHQVSYAEDGKRFEGISFADGLGRPHQSLGHNTETQQVIVSNTYYDGYGRPVLSDLPTPDNNENLTHRANFNHAEGASFYGPEHFDWEFLQNSPTCAFETTPFDANYGAGKYYSPNNTDMDGENARIPDAEQYPFSRVEYMKDHTGRIRRVGNVGPDFQVGSGHETEFFYATPSQEELDRLFGSEAGYAPHYQKRITVDANEQMYIEYFDMAGRVVASGLAGQAPANLSALDNNTILTATQTISEGLQGEITPTSMTLVQPLNIVLDEDYTFNYDLNPSQFTAETCMPEICFDCAYTLIIKISEEECGDTIYGDTLHINGGEYDAICNGTYPFADDFTVHLAKNHYILTKTLTVDQDAINAYWCTYLENNTCIPTYAELFNELYANADFGVCDNVIEEDPEDDQSCATIKTAMLHDVSPGGQYGQYTVGGTAYTASSTISVLYTGGSPDLTGNWKNPSGYYKDVNGDSAYVEVTAVSGGYSPAITGSVIGSQLPNGHYRVLPQQLVNLSDFVQRFEESWAEALLLFHPEYCYLQFCEANVATHDYDVAMSGITEFDAAKAGGYFAPKGTVLVNSAISTSLFSGANNPDPFAVSNTALQNKLSHYTTIAGLSLTMLDYAIILTNCPDAATYNDARNCLTAFYVDSCKKDLLWLTFRDLYLETKALIYAQAEAAYVSGQPCATNANKIGTTAPFTTCIPRWGFVSDALATDYSQPANDPFAGSAAQSAAVCETVAAAYVDEWLAMLSDCPTITDLDSTERTNLRKDLIAFSSYGCNEQHPLCATTLPPGASLVFSNPNGGTLTGGASINDLLALRVPGFTESDLCTELLISDPGPYETNVAEDVYLDTCGCDLLLATNAEFREGHLPESITTVEQLLAYNTGLSLEDIDDLICRCDKVAGNWTPNYDWTTGHQTAIASWNEIVPQQLTCDDCIQCEAITAALEDLTTRFGSEIPMSDNYPTILTNFFNEQFGFDLNYGIYNDFMAKCDAKEANPFCEATDELLAFGGTLNLLAHQGQLTATSPLNLLTTNVVYKNGALYDYLQATHSTAAVEGSTLELTFIQEGTPLSCETFLHLPEAAAFTFSDIVSFGLIHPTGGSCETNANTFEVEVNYYDCGQLRYDTLTGTTDCFPVQTCYCGGAITLCNETVGEQFADATPCYEPLLSQLYQEAAEAYDAALLEARDQFETDYNLACSAAFSTERITYSGPVNHYQYTLFYYDQAGNLVKTVAPKGVTILDPTTAAVTARDSSTIDVPLTVAPTHTFDTKYRYNSYDQLVYTTNPDQEDSTKYWYDRYGRIVASQNPVQALDKKYSYVLYDAQGRPIEVGQADRDGLLPQVVVTDASVGLKNDDLGVAFKTWVYNCARTEVTRTVYDKPYSTAIAAKFAGNVQQNLRLRVAAVLYYPTVPAAQPPTTGYESAMHYSYDLHGNVIESLQDIPVMAPVEQDIVSTRYQFELLSGNVKKVEYQKERWDAGTSTWKTRRDRLTHEYAYDQLNRLTEVTTSTDNGVHKNREARYRYFDYGPLSRVEIGQHNVQGNDYAYTLQGWLKAMNGTTLDRQRDGGRDGGTGYLAANPGVNQLFASDVTGYTLGYYNGDYKSIAATSFEATVGTGNAMSHAIRSLYNGNIAWTTMAIDGYETKGGVYVYDQLQRLKAMRIFHSSGLQATNSWTGSIETREYSSSYNYDQNGNLTKLVRKGTASIALDMDNFTYRYIQNANRLTHVTDSNGATPGYTSDINDGQVGASTPQPITASQSGNNYQYDKLGQLVKDVQEGNQAMTWRFGDKKLLKQLSDTRQLEFIYNPFGQRVVKIEKQCVAGVVQAQTSGVPWIYTYYGYDANGQVLSTYTVTLNGATKEEATIDEQMLLGAGRVGLRQASQLIWSNVTSIPAETSLWLNKLGKKRYELSNHLGNVNAVITDRKVVNTGYVVLANEDYATSTIIWDYSSSCGAPVFTVSGGKLTVTNGNCTMFVARTVAAVAGTVYTFSVDVVDHSAIAGFSIELQAGPSSTGPFSLIVPAFTNVANGRFSYTFTVPSGMTHVRYGFKKLTTETGMGFTIDNLYLGTAVARYAAVPLQKMDYYPFGMEMTGGIELGSIPASVTGSGTIVEERVVYTSHFRTVTNGDGDLQLSPGSATSSTDNSANGVQMVLPGEYIEFTASPDPIATNRTFVGLSYVDGGFLQTTINYSWYIYPTGSSYVFESGTQMYANHTAYVPGTTTWRIARTGGNIVYYKNGVAVRTVAETNPNTPMVIDITLWNTGTVDKARVYNLKVGKLQFVVATYAIGDYVPYVHSDYRFGYNGMEKDPEMKGDGNSYTTEFRQYDPRLGRWMSLDPLAAQFPGQSPYCAFDDNPVLLKDPLGLAATNENAKPPKDKHGILGAFKKIVSWIKPSSGKKNMDSPAPKDWVPSFENVIVNGNKKSPKSRPWKPKYDVSQNSGQCFTNSPTIKGKAPHVKENHVVVPGTTVIKLIRKDGEDPKEAIASSALVAGGSSRSGGLLGVLIIGGYILYESENYTYITIQEIRVNPEDFEDDDDYVSNDKMGRQHGNTPRNNGDQNKQVRDLVVKYGLSKSLQRKLHDLISKKGYGYKEIEEIIKDPINGLLK